MLRQSHLKPPFRSTTSRRNRHYILDEAQVESRGAWGYRCPFLALSRTHSITHINTRELSATAPRCLHALGQRLD